MPDAIEQVSCFKSLQTRGMLLCVVIYGSLVVFFESIHFKKKKNICLTWFYT